MAVDTALLIVDFQNDFTIGALPNPRCHEIAELMGVYLPYHVDDRVLIASRDAHESGPEVQAHFDNFGEHCRKGSHGYQFFSRFPSGYMQHIVDKGAHSASASAFDGVDRTGATLDQILKGHGIRKLEVCGFVAEVCVMETIRDAMTDYNYQVTWLPGLTAALTPEGHDSVARQVLGMGGHIR